MPGRLFDGPGGPIGVGRDQVAWPRRGRVPQSLSREACMELFGGTQRTTPPGSPTALTPVALMDLSKGIGSFSSLPGVIVLNLDYIESESGGAVPKRGAIDLFAELSWETGGGRQRAEVDVPAHGTTVHLVCGDGLQVRFFRGGDPIAGTVDNDEELWVRATAGFADGVNPTAQRTQREQIPVAAPIPAVPRFARTVSVYQDLGAFAAGDFLRLFNERAGPVVALIDLTQPAPHAVPNNCRFWDATVAGVPVLTAVWGLAI